MLDSLLAGDQSGILNKLGTIALLVLYVYRITYCMYLLDGLEKSTSKRFMDQDKNKANYTTLTT